MLGQSWEFKKANFVDIESSTEFDLMSGSPHH